MRIVGLGKADTSVLDVEFAHVGESAMLDYKKKKRLLLLQCGLCKEAQK